MYWVITSHAGRHMDVLGIHIMGRHMNVLGINIGETHGCIGYSHYTWGDT